MKYAHVNARKWFAQWVHDQHASHYENTEVPPNGIQSYFEIIKTSQIER